MRRHISLIWGGILIGLIALGGLYLANRPATAPVTNSSVSSAPRPALGELPAVVLQNYSGQTVNLKDLIGTPLVINSWAAWCPFCKKELPDLAAAQKEFGERVKVVAIDRAETLNIAQKYSDTAGVTSTLTMLLDPTDSFYQAIGGFAMPETIFVDAAGKIRAHKRGPMTITEIRERINILLAN